MPQIDNILGRRGWVQVLSSLDLSKGFWQIPLHHSDKPKMAFDAPLGLYQCTMMPFGLNGATASFQRVMDKAPRGMQDCTVACIVDILIYRTLVGQPPCPPLKGPRGPLIDGIHG